MSTNRIIGRVVSVASACVLVACMAAISDDIGDPITDVLGGGSANQLSLVGVRVQRIAGVATKAVVSYSNDNVTLVSYGFGALVLVGLMLRSSRSM